MILNTQILNFSLNQKNTQEMALHMPSDRPDRLLALVEHRRQLHLYFKSVIRVFIQ